MNKISFLSLIFITLLSACAGKGSVIINGRNDTATMTFLQDDFSVCVRGQWNDFSAKDGLVIIPAGERITVKSIFAVNDGHSSPDCQHRVSFVAEKDKHYIGDILIYDKSCIVDIVSEDDTMPNGLAILNNISAGQSNCQ